MKHILWLEKQLKKLQAKTFVGPPAIVPFRAVCSSLRIGETANAFLFPQAIAPSQLRRRPVVSSSLLQAPRRAKRCIGIASPRPLRGSEPCRSRIPPLPSPIRLSPSHSTTAPMSSVRRPHHRRQGRRLVEAHKFRRDDYEDSSRNSPWNGCGTGPSTIRAVGSEHLRHTVIDSRCGDDPGATRSSRVGRLPGFTGRAGQ